MGGVRTAEVVCGLTGRPPERAGAAALMHILRDHWEIENERRYARDVTRGEGRCRVRSGAAPQVLAARRHAVLHPLSAVTAPSRPAALEYLQIHPDEARLPIGIPQTQ